MTNSEKYKRHYLSSNQKLASTQTHGSVFLDRFRKTQNSKYEPDLLKTTDCFIGCRGPLNSDYVNLRLNNQLSHNVFSVVCPDKSLKTKYWCRKS